MHVQRNRDRRVHPEVEIMRRYEAPNLDRQRGLVRLDHFTWSQAREYDALERRQRVLIELQILRGLDAEEDRELAHIEEELRAIEAGAEQAHSAFVRHDAAAGVRSW